MPVDYNVLISGIGMRPFRLRPEMHRSETETRREVGHFVQDETETRHCSSRDLAEAYGENN